MKQLEFILNKLVDFILESKLSTPHHSLTYHTVYCNTHIFKSKDFQEMIFQFVISIVNDILILILVGSLELKLIYEISSVKKTKPIFKSREKKMSK